MANQKIGTIIHAANPVKKQPIRLNKEQLEALNEVSKIALALIAAAGIIALSAVAPNIFIALDKIYRLKGKILTVREKEVKIAQTFYYLKKTGVIQLKPTGVDFKILLTKIGRNKIRNLELETLRVAKQKKWDGKWWQVAADIPTKQHRQDADLLRRKLKQMGFYPLQRTLWYYPYDPRKEIQFIIDRFRIAQFVTVMEISRLDVEDEKMLKAHFKRITIL